MQKITLLILSMIVSQISHAKSLKINPLASEQTKQFASMLGEWKITDYALDKQGKWQKSTGADWNWYTILNGHAIQDDWIQPSLSTKLEDESKRGYGTNIRIYNPKTNLWEMAWASSNGKKVDNFSAKFEDNKIIMTGFYAGGNTRVTFYDMKPDSFEWKMEMQSKDDKKLWKEVYRIHGDRKK